ncbi:MAG: 6-hydroxymethylpterin diphosphokinase MptE-like protein [Candidatus Hodarchaeales archaeon]|jgi:uncharacterized Rossmann fold enzyme
MQWANWEVFYKDIIAKLRIDSETDYETTKILQHYFRDQKEQVQSRLRQLRELCRKMCIIFGAGPSLAIDLANCLHADILSSCTTITADGATSEFIRRDIAPNIIVTDLDGDMNHIEAAARKGSILVVHAHGDNEEKINTWIPRLLQFHPIPTTQVEPMPPIENFGGFTDGDRAAFMAVDCGCTTLALAGFDLGDVVGHVSKPDLSEDVIATPRKKLKLEIAAELLQVLCRHSSTDEKISFFNLTAKAKTPLEGFVPITPKELAQHILSKNLPQPS